MKQKILSVNFDNVNMDEALNIAFKAAEDGRKCMVVTPNAEIAYMAEKDKKLLDIINEAGLVLPDGVGVILASKIIGKPLKQKVAGVEFAESLLSKYSGPVYLLGGKPGVAATAKSNLEKKYPGCNIVGVNDGYFKNADEVIEKINQSGAKVLFVCLGAPKQEFFIHENMSKLSPSVIAGLGGSLDVFAGTAKRAPDIFIKLGLEWFYRLLKQPSRIKRMSVLPLYVLKSVKYKLFGGK